MALSQEPLIAASIDGRRFVYVRRPSANQGGSANYQIQIRDERERLEVTHNVAYLPRPVEKALVDGQLDSLSKHVVAIVPRAFLLDAAARRAIQKQIPIPAFYPPVAEALLEDDGSVWLREQSASIAPEVPQNQASTGIGTAWVRLDGNGRLTGGIRVPPGVELRVVDGATFWGVEMDSVGAPIVIRLRPDTSYEYREGTNGKPREGSSSAPPKRPDR